MEYMEIITSLNNKVNKHMEQTKIEISGLQNLAAVGGPQRSGGDSLVPANRNYSVENEVERLKLDLQRMQQNDRMRQEEMENFFKRASVDYFNKLQDAS